ncbi:ATP-binding protein [Priestia megaterium]|uniref:ATP-binding protein n=1 Tax=Priestia megaterium TaxID=1404 RepID=UPI000BFB8EE7|nr:ATP-binding protein [Priestia megaterium]PGN62198.1 ATP-binding protein [Priestia megaterium]
MDNTILTQPSARPVLHALRSIGYRAKTAIADLIDNCIDASATQIQVNFIFEEFDGYITIKDNGIGMDNDTLQDAMNIGSKDPRDPRKPKELGRFGMGLKTASFSLGKRLSVLTKRDGIYHERCWDLDHVSDCNKWELFRNIPIEVKDKMGEIEGTNGTIVCIDKLDRFMGAGTDKLIKESSFNSKVRRIKEHLGFVFHSLISKSKLSMYINGNLITSWDPFLLNNPRLIEGEQQVIKVNHHKIVVTPYVLPHSSYFNTVEYNEAGGIKGWRDHQGFYIYRENRLLHFGDWLGLFPKDTASQLARIRIDLPNTADSEWQVDVKKSMITAPEEAKENLKAIAEIHRQISKEIFYFRTKSSYGGQKIKGSLNTWEPSGNDNGYGFVLNRTHPILNEIIDKVDSDTLKLLNMYLKFVELGSPSNITHTTKPIDEEIQPIEDGVKELVMQFASMMIDSGLVSNQEQLIDVLMTQPGFGSLNRKTVKTIIEDGEMFYERSS